MTRTGFIALACQVLALLFFFNQRAVAEPYLAVQQGMKCMGCHVNPTGGGMRNAYGDIYGQAVLPQKRIDTGEPWVGDIGRFLRIGGNLRAAATFNDVPHQKSQTSFDLSEARLYLEVRAIPDRVTLYVDQHIAPGGSTNSEAYGRLWFGAGKWYVQGGQMYLPYGLRLQDDTAFIRQVPGINFATPDRGVQIGLETTLWSAQLAISNGTAGGPATDEGKQYSLRAERVSGRWRAGASFNFNDAASGKRQMQNLFAGLRTGPIGWLAEADYIIDDNFTPRRKQAAGLLEANWKLRPGHNLKVTGELFDPDTSLSHDAQNRYSIVWEYTPVQFMQFRVGARNYDGIPQNDLQNRRLVFAELNGYF